MKKNYILILLLLVTSFAFSQGSEDFTNSNATSSYADDNFVGNSGVTWSYVASRDANADANGSGITLPALMLRRAASGSKVTSSPVSGGIADFSVKLYKGFTGGGDRQVELFVNGASQGTSTAFDDFNEHVFTVSGINIGGDVTIELVNTTTKQIIVDDITWTAYAGAATPSLSINSPAEGSTTPSGDVSVMFAVSNFDVGAADGTHDGHIHYTVDGGSTNMKYDTSAIDLTGLTAGAHTVYMELVDDTHVAINPAVNATVNFNVQAYTQVADIATLRAGTMGDAYELTGEAFINYAQSYRSQKFIQDATAGILIDDSTGNITAGDRGDGLSGIKGTLSEYNGQMQFVPALDATLVSPSTLTITPQEVTFADLTANAEMYESELVKVSSVMVDGSTDPTFVNGTMYPMTQGSDTFNFRTNFYGVDYIGGNVPAAAQDIVGLISERADGYVFTARDLADFQDTAAIIDNSIEGLSVYPNPSKDIVNISTLNNMTKHIRVNDILGKQVLNVTLQGNVLNIASLNKGIYLLNIFENGNTATVKLVVE